jgi:signal peptidase I
MSDASSADAPSKRGLLHELIQTALSLAVALLIAVGLHTILFQPFTIPSSSMEPGLVTGDYIVVSKFAYGWSRASLPLDPPLFRGRLFGRPPARGDVVVFRLPRDPGQTWVKRVIGLPGDRIQVTDGIVFVNGRPLPQTPLGSRPDHDHPAQPVTVSRETLPNGRTHLVYDEGPGREGDDTGVYVVPAGSYFMMGDNRDDSLDSRWPRELGVGYLPAQDIVGKAEIVLASWKPGASLLKPWTWLKLQPGRFFKPIR